MADSTSTSPPRWNDRRLFLAGVLLPFAGIALFAVQMASQRLWYPWYVPGTALSGVLLIGAALSRKRTWLRGIAFGMVFLLAGLELAGLWAVSLPEYAGPLKDGTPFPAFQTTRADGSSFRDSDLKGDQNTAIVFFRGRW